MNEHHLIFTIQILLFLFVDVHVHHHLITDSLVRQHGSSSTWIWVHNPLPLSLYCEKMETLEEWVMIWLIQIWVALFSFSHHESFDLITQGFRLGAWKEDGAEEDGVGEEGFLGSMVDADPP